MMIYRMVAGHGTAATWLPLLTKNSHFSCELAGKLPQGKKGSIVMERMEDSTVRWSEKANRIKENQLTALLLLHTHTGS
jgi:hypothetical protein